jgi:cobalt-zinc-cadmium efflux system membrane fusion protein
MKTIPAFAALVLCIIFLAFCSGTDSPPTEGEHVHDEAQAGHTHEGEDPAQVTQSQEGEAEPEEHSHEGEEAGHTHEQDAEAAPVEGEEEHQHLDVTKDKQNAWGIRVGHVHKESLTARVSLPGVLALNQNRTAHVSAFVHGQVSDLAVDLGRKVRKGQPMLTLNSPEFAELQADFLQARAAYNLSRTEYQRAESLWEARAIEQKEFLRRQAEHERLSTEYGALGSKLHSLGLTHDQIDKLILKCSLMEEQEYKCDVANPLLPLLAPLSGTVIFRDAVKGAHIEPETTLFTISDLGKLWANLDVYEKDIPLVSQQSRISIQSSLYPDRSFPAKITYISNLIDEKLRTMRVRVEVDNPQGQLKPNMYVQGLLESDVLGGEKVLAVPEEAVQNLDGEKIVFVREASEVFAVRHVRIGEQVGDHRIILAGLTEHEDVVLKGAFTLKTELSKGTFGHSHVH